MKFSSFHPRHFVALCSLIALGVPVAHGQPAPSNLEKHLRNAQIHLDQQQYEQAVEELRAAITIHPKLAGANYQLGLAQWHLGQFEASEKAFLKELEFAPPDPYSLYYLGLIRWRAGDVQGAIDRLEQVVKIGDVLDVRARLATAYLRSGKIEKALPILEEQVEKSPERGDLHYLLGRAYLQLGRREDAEREMDLSKLWKTKQRETIESLSNFRELLKSKKVTEARTILESLSKSSDPNILLAAGMTLGHHGSHTEATMLFERAIELQPSYAEAHYNLGRTYAVRKQHQQAVPPLQKSIELRPDFYEAQMLLGTVWSQLGERESAIRCLRAASRLRPGNPRLLAFLGLLYIEERYYAEAIPTLEQAIVQDPENPELRFLLIQAHFKNHDFERAIKIAEETRDRFPNVARSHYELAAQMENMGRLEEAKLHLDAALERDHGFVPARALLGKVLLTQGQAEQSIAEFRTALAADPELMSAYAGLGSALVELKQYEEAAKTMEAAIRRDSEIAPLHLYLSQAYRALGETERAKQEAAIFARLNRERAAKRDKDVERDYEPAGVVKKESAQVKER